MGYAELVIRPTEVLVVQERVHQRRYDAITRSDHPPKAHVYEQTPEGSRDWSLAATVEDA